jgi:hypothetical protein
MHMGLDETRNNGEISGVDTRGAFRQADIACQAGGLNARSAADDTSGRKPFKRAQ